MKSPTISVIMSVYNDADYIEKAIVSLLVQTFNDFEIIIINDGSTDKTEKLIRKINDPRINLINRPNRGLTKSLNYALSKAKGKWIARQDADDISIFNRFERQIDYLQKHPKVKLLGSAQFVIRRYDLVEEIFSFPCDNEIIEKALSLYNPFVHGSMIIDKDLLIKNNGYNEKYRYVQDYELWTRLVPQTFVKNLSTPLYIRCVHKNCSEAKVDKEPIFQEIQNQYLKFSFGRNIEDNDSETLIKSKSIYPIVSFADKHSLLLAKHYMHMFRGLKKYGTSSYRSLLNSFIYCPVIPFFYRFPKIEK